MCEVFVKELNKIKQYTIMESSHLCYDATPVNQLSRSNENTRNTYDIGLFLFDAHFNICLHTSTMITFDSPSQMLLFCEVP